MNKTGKRRLLKLADMLEADAKNKKGIRFHLNVVVGKSADEMLYGFDRYVTEDFKPELSCGTTACAMGFAALSGAFKKAGLSYKLRGEDIIDTTWKGRLLTYDKAAVKLFGISQGEANWLFTPDSYYDKETNWKCEVKGAKGERRVARRIRKLVAGKADITDLTA